MAELTLYEGPLKVGLHHFLSQGPAGLIETLTQAPVSWDQQDIAILCHPNPLSEGTMHNKVVTTLAKAYAEQGIATIRFQFRGVGASEGVHGEGISEQEDVLALIETVKKYYPKVRVHLGGFSFGGYVSTAVAYRLGVAVSSLIIVAPAVTMRDFSGFKGIECPWLIVQGEEDDLIPLDNVLSTFKSLMPFSPKLELIQLLGASHFFHGKLIELHAVIVHYLSQIMESLNDPTRRI